MEGLEVDPATAEFLSVMTPGHFYSRGLASAPRPEDFNSDDFFNEEPPSPLVTFIIGGVSLVWASMEWMFFSMCDNTVVLICWGLFR